MKLSERVEKLTGPDNKVDVLVEVALFDPVRETCISCRANDAGTKVIYTYLTGPEQTYWPRAWTLTREDTTAILRARGL